MTGCTNRILGPWWLGAHWILYDPASRTIYGRKHNKTQAGCTSLDGKMSNRYLEAAMLAMQKGGVSEPAMRAGWAVSDPAECTPRHRVEVHTLQLAGMSTNFYVGGTIITGYAHEPSDLQVLLELWACRPTLY